MKTRYKIPLSFAALLLFGQGCAQFDEVRRPEFQKVPQSETQDAPELESQEPKKLKIQAIPYQGTHIPLDQIHRSTGAECDKDEHWHADAGSVITVEGEIIEDEVACGYGKTKEVPVVEIEIDEAG